MNKLNHINTAYDYFKTGDYAKAWNLCQSILQQKPEQVDCLAILGSLCNKASKYGDAENYLRKCLALHPQPHIILTELATSLIHQNKLQEADNVLAKSLAINKQYNKTYIQQAKLLKLQHKYYEAEQILRALLVQNPKSVAALNNLGTLLVGQKAYDKALEIFRKALILKPQAATYKNIALIELNNNKQTEALRNFVLAHKLLPTDISILFEIGKIYMKKRQLKKAKPIFKQILQIEPTDMQSLMYLGIIYSNTAAFEKSKVLFEKILQQKPDYSEAFYELARCKSHLADWHNWEQTRAQMIAFIERDLKKETPIACSTYDTHYYNIPDSLQYQLMRATKQRYNKVAAEQFSFTNRKHTKIRLGYMSPDFRAHALGMSVYKMFRHHNRTDFEIYTFSLHTPNSEDVFYKTISSDAHHSFDLSSFSAQAAAQLIYDNEIDILIDFGGYTRFTKPEILIMKPAPLQIMMCGQPDTTAIPQVDYFISDKLLIDETNRKFYTESILYLPHGFICSPIKASEKKLSRKDLGIAEDSFLFCSFCSPYKYEPNMFSVWMKLLNEVENSALCLLSNANSVFEQNIKKEASKQAVDKNRIIFVKHLPIQDHLNRMEICDLFLDTPFYSSSSSGLHTLMMGLPIVTLRGNTNAKRQGASVCHAAQIDDLICSTKEEYYEKALELAQSPQKLAAVKGRLIKNKEQIPLFNLPLNVGYIESACHAIWKNYLKGEACADTEIKSIRIHY